MTLFPIDSEPTPAPDKHGLIALPADLLPCVDDPMRMRVMNAVKSRGREGEVSV